jgi:DNA-binding IclR family transcriptional regulator
MQINHSVNNALTIIEYLTKRDWCRLKDISSDLSMDLSKVHRLVNTMLEKNYIEYDKNTRRYRLGYKFFTITHHMSQTNSLISLSRSHLEWAAVRLSETINLGILSGSMTSVTHVLQIEGNKDVVRLDVPVGSDTHIHASGLGKCLLAFMSPGEQSLIASKLNYIKFTENTITSEKELLKELQIIRSQGYAIDRGEYHPNMCCLAVPIISSSGRIVAALSMSIYGTEEDLHEPNSYPILKEAASRISKAMG